jgi:hypothetical protein
VLVRDTDGDEESGFDSAIVPSDFERAGVILDDFVNARLCRPLPAGVRLTIVCDCCHSGSCADLEFEWRWNGEQRQFRPRARVRSRDFRRATRKHCDADIVMISGCKDEQTSADVNDTADFQSDLAGASSASAANAPGSAGGACTNALAEALSMAPRGADGQPRISYLELLFRLQENLALRRFTQSPQLASSKHLDMNRPFALAGPLQ